jgi:hypothetical protein
MLVASFMRVSRLVYSSTLKMEVVCSFETSIDFHRTAQPYILEDRNFMTTAVRTSNPALSLLSEQVSAVSDLTARDQNGRLGAPTKRKYNPQNFWHLLL